LFIWLNGKRQVGQSIILNTITSCNAAARTGHKMALILPEGFNPDEKESPLENIYDHAFPIADKLSFAINESTMDMVKDGKITDKMSDAIIIHSIALMLIVCMMNREVLEDNTLDTTFKKVKGITQDYLKHLLEAGKEKFN